MPPPRLTQAQIAEESFITSRALAFMLLQKLTPADSTEILNFLAERPLHTVIMAGFINDHGVVSELHRGIFYGCRNEQEQLEGVALIGHVTLFEARTDAALEAFAQLARSCPQVSLLAGEQEKLERFWDKFAARQQAPRQSSLEFLYVQHDFVDLQGDVNVRPAEGSDIEVLLPVYASMVFEASGINPLETDPAGFRSRLMRRVEKGRVLVWIEGEELLFTASIVSDTALVNYLEGVYVNPAHRGKGYGLRCMSQVSKKLLAHTRAICGLVNEGNRAAQALYRKAGYESHSCYKKIYV
jgi:predicted GNAT family acetyltransferase